MINLNLQNYEVQDGEKNTVLSKKIEIDNEINCFIIVDSKKTIVVLPIFNKIVDYLIDSVTVKNINESFGLALENINFFVKTIEEENQGINDLNILIALLDKNNNLYFSKIGDASCYLISRRKEITPISDENNNENKFDSISSGKISYGERVIFSNANISNIISNSDWDDITESDDVEKMNQLLKSIFDEENINYNIALISLLSDYSVDTEKVEKNTSKIKDFLYKMCDNIFIKKIIAFYLIIKEKIEFKSKFYKNLLFVFGIIISSVLLFLAVKSLLNINIKDSEPEKFKNDLISASDYVDQARGNLNNEELFKKNLKKAEELIAKVDEKKYFEKDSNDIKNKISKLKKQYFGIESFETNLVNSIASANNYKQGGDFSSGFKVLEINNKFYILGNRGVFGPIVQGQKIENHLFEEMDQDDYFTEGTVVKENLILTTAKGRVVNFGKDFKFKYLTIGGEDSWKGSTIIDSYNTNIYMSEKDKKQLYKYSPLANNYILKDTYFKDEDMRRIGNILSIGIDGGIYILNDKGELLKLFTAEKKVEVIRINKKPENFVIEKDSIPRIVVKNNMSVFKYIYIFLNNRIYIFKPNTDNYNDTKFVTYIGQIEGKNEKILGFNVLRDGEINVLTKSGIYKVGFIEDETSGKIMINN